MSESVLRYVGVMFAADDRLSWYIDESDSVEAHDLVVVPYSCEERLGEAVQVLRCVPPYLPYPERKTGSILRIEKRKAESAK